MSSLQQNSIPSTRWKSNVLRLIVVFSLILGVGCSEEDNGIGPDSNLKRPANVTAICDDLNFGSSENQISFTLNNSGSESGTFSLHASGAWVNFNDTTGTVAGNTQVQIIANLDRSTLSLGLNEMFLLIQTDSVVTDSLPVLAQHNLFTVSPGSLHFTSEVQQLSITIDDTSGSGIDWVITCDQGWLSATPSSGTGSATVIIQADRQGIDIDTTEGMIEGMITINANNSQRVELQARVEIDPDPILFMESLLLDFQASMDTLQMTITNLGGSSLEWQIQPNAGWISVTPLNGTTPATARSSVLVIIDRSQFPPGSDFIQSTITIQSNATNNEDQDVIIKAINNIGSVRGTVTCANSRLPVADVMVELAGVYAMTDSAGEYEIQDIPSGSYTVTCSKLCYNTQYSSVEIETGSSVTVDISVSYVGPENECTVTRDYYRYFFPNETNQCDSIDLYVPDAVDIQLYFVHIELGFYARGDYFKIVDARDGSTICKLEDDDRMDWWTGWCGTNHVIITCCTGSYKHVGYELDKYLFHQ